ncbi:MAG: ElyC/SanA/YdcF family protein [Chloroflexota bacterium]|nr:ElyC/SanA/YdcF family protein [Chloroflexota bacterium]
MKSIQDILRTGFHVIIYLAFAAFFIIGILRVAMLLHAKGKTYLAETVPQSPAALVLGAGLNRDGTPGLVLQDRVRTASDLYFSGKVEKILMSGDNTSENYNEPGAMKDFAIELGIPEEDIVLDFAGRRTYDSCYRAKAIFGLEKLTLVTQAYHLPRALLTCNALDIDAGGVPADDANYRRSSYTFWWVREILASIKAYWDIYIGHPQPILGQPEPIFE